jgi:hypothetical protein
MITSEPAGKESAMLKFRKSCVVEGPRTRRCQNVACEGVEYQETDFVWRGIDILGCCFVSGRVERRRFLAHSVGGSQLDIGFGEIV